MRRYPAADMQAPAEHRCPAAHDTPHRAQFAAEARSASQPLAGFMSQSANPALQRYSQLPALHPAVMLGRAGQALPQRPQWVTELERPTSHPSAAVALQSPKPALQVKMQRLSDPQRAIDALAGAVQGSLRVPNPSAVQTERAAVPVGQVAVPGTQAQLEHIVPVHVDDAGQVRFIAVVPSTLHTRTVRVSTQEELPGVHTRFTQAPSVHRCIAPQGVIVVPKPSALQTLRTDDDTQVMTPGTHVRPRQAPSRQPSPGAHVEIVVDSPSSAHTRRSVCEPHVAVLGVQTRGTHAPSRHDSLVPQGTAV